MDSYKQFELQNQIRENSSGINSKISELHKWEKDIKRTSASDYQTKKNENAYPIRSHKEDAISNGFPKTPTVAKKENETIKTTQSEANVYKESGNKCVKNQEFEAALNHYTEAIKLYDSDPVFYSNRAFCFLKLERYTECIDDCSKAIQLNPKLVKAYYRRMQANEVLCNYDLAFNDCKEVLKLDPKNTDAVSANQRLSNRIAGKDLSKQTTAKITQQPVTWSKLDASVKDINFIKKPPHLRSKKPLRRIQINQPQPSNIGATSNKKSKDEENEAFKSADTNHDESNQLSNGLSLKADELLSLKSPLSSAEFYRTWRELVDNSQKYSYLKIIDAANLNKLLGPQFNSEMFSELLKILSEFFIRDNVPVAGILKQIVINDEFKILSLFMDSDDKIAFDKLLKYIESNEQEDFSAFIKQKYFNLM